MNRRNWIQATLAAIAAFFGLKFAPPEDPNLAFNSLLKPDDSFNVSYWAESLE